MMSKFSKRDHKKRRQNKGRSVDRVPRGIFVVPDAVTVDLCFNDTTLTRGSTAGITAYCSWRYRTSAYDPDPLLGTGAISGFSEWAGFYTKYRVEAMSIDATVTNLMQSTPIVVGIVPTPLDLGANYSSSYQLPEFRHAKSTILSTQGGLDRARLKGTCTWQNMIADVHDFDSNYSAATNSNPNTMFYWNVFAFASTGNISTVALATNIKIIYRVHFFDRKTIPS